MHTIVLYVLVLISSYQQLWTEYDEAPVATVYRVVIILPKTHYLEFVTILGN